MQTASIGADAVRPPDVGSVSTACSTPMKSSSSRFHTLRHIEMIFGNPSSATGWGEQDQSIPRHCNSAVAHVSAAQLESPTRKRRCWRSPPTPALLLVFPAGSSRPKAVPLASITRLNRLRLEKTSRSQQYRHMGDIDRQSA